jgi:hypothetical protein
MGWWLVWGWCCWCSSSSAHLAGIEFKGGGYPISLDGVRRDPPNWAKAAPAMMEHKAVFVSEPRRHPGQPRKAAEQALAEALYKRFLLKRRLYELQQSGSVPADAPVVRRGLAILAMAGRSV